MALPFAALAACVVQPQVEPQIEWVRQFGLTTQDWLRAVAVGASGVYVAGWTEGTLPGQVSAGGRDAFVCKYDTNGKEDWTRQFGTKAHDEATAIA